MSKYAYFFTGIITGVYISQNYNVPNLIQSINMLSKQISYYEKQNENNKN
jgi:hypothetical protein